MAMLHPCEKETRLKQTKAKINFCLCKIYFQISFDYHHYYHSNQTY